MENIYIRKYQTLVLFDWLKTLGNEGEVPDDYVTEVISYFSCIGGQASEANIIKLLKWTGVNFNDKDHQIAIKRLFSYYYGAKMIHIIDNHLGIKQHLENTKLASFKAGQRADVTPLREGVADVSNRISKVINHYEVNDDHE